MKAATFQKNLYLLLPLLFFVALGTLCGLGKCHWLIPAVYAAVSVIAFVLYRLDKRKAVSGQWRTPELTLQLSGLLCGWPGAMAAQVILRHKNAKAPYQIVFWLCTLLNLGALVGLFFLLAKH